MNISDMFVCSRVCVSVVVAPLPLCGIVSKSALRPTTQAEQYSSIMSLRESVWCLISQVKIPCVFSLLPDLIVSALLPPLSVHHGLFWQPWVSGVWVGTGSHQGLDPAVPPASPSSTLILLTGPNPPWDNAIPEGSWVKPLFLPLRYIKSRQLWSRGQSTLKHSSLFAFHLFSVLFILPSPAGLWAEQVHLPTWATPSRARPHCLQSLWILPSSTLGSDAPWALSTLPDSLTSFLERACLTTTSSPTPPPPSALITDSRSSAAFWILPTPAPLR